MIVTVRLIRSFEHRNIKHIVYKNIDGAMLVEDFMEFIKNDIKSRSGLPPPFRNYAYDQLKIQHQPHGAKTSDPVINSDDDEKLMLKLRTTLADNNVGNETEISFFRNADYENYKVNKSR
ncbi:UPF0538 protein C2orf76-like [Amphiura filiformis]|uniref:UPF0538 protein C2orf76-like n=1 Tax=Amphiura filiformis TaxID=82378 RepID=UPI003B2257A9